MKFNLQNVFLKLFEISVAYMVGAQLCQLFFDDAHTFAIKQLHGEITRHYSCVHKCELSYRCFGHDVKLHPYRMKLYRRVCEILLGIGKGANVIISK